MIPQESVRKCLDPHKIAPNEPPLTTHCPHIFQSYKMGNQERSIIIITDAT